MKKLYILVTYILLGSTAAPAQQWSYQGGGYGLGANTMSIQKVTDDLMFLQSFPMMRSGDGGTSWQYVTYEGNVATFTQPSFIDSNTGWVGGGKVDMFTPPTGPFGSPYIPQVLKTTDSGKTWSALPVTGLTGLNIPRFIKFFDANHGVIAGDDVEFAMLIFRTTDGGRTWTKVFSSGDLYGVVEGEFVSATVGYISSSDGIVKTNDAGATWQALPTPADESKNQNIYRQDFVSPTHGWVAGSGNLLASTTDGGETWTSIETGMDAGGIPGDVSIVGLRFVDDTHGYISSTQGKLFYTSDGGESWADRSPEGIDSGYSNDFLFLEDAGHVLFVTNTDVMLATADAGLTWENRNQPFILGTTLTDITFAGSQKGWAVGLYGTLVQSLDGGVHWDYAPNPSWQSEEQAGRSLYSLAAQNENTIWAVGEQGTVLHTANAMDWTASTVGTKDLHDIFFLRGVDKGWIVGNENTIFHYDGAGWSAQTAPSTNSAALRAVFFVNDQVGWAVGDKGTILKTTNGGSSWLPKNSGILRQLNDVYFVDVNTGFAVGNNDYILKSTDGGESWRPLVIPHAFVGDMQAVYFSSPHRGWVAGSDETRGAIYQTTDGGNSWKRAPLFGTKMEGMYFNDLNNGWAVDDGGKIFKFDDSATGSSDATIPFPSMDFEPVKDTLYNFDRAKYVLRDSTIGAGIPFLGKNHNGHEEFGEKYYVEDEAWVAGVIVHHHGAIVHPGNVAEYNVFTVNEQGFPDAKVGRKDIHFGDIDLSQNASTILFNEPVRVNDAFFVTFNLTDYYHGGFDGDNIGIMHTSNNTRPKADEEARNVVRVHDHSDRVWRPISAAYNTTGYRGNLAIFPIVYRKTQVTGIEDSREAGGITVRPAFPNPTQGDITFVYDLSRPETTSVAIFDMQGKRVFESEPQRQEPGNHTQQLSLDHLKPGLYCYKIQAGNISVSSKFIVTP